MGAPPDFSKRIPQLDGLRGVAIAMVVLFHYVTSPLAPGSSSILARTVSLCWSGVDLFFVLSGFLIGGILMDARGSANYFRVFYRRRVCRIFPLYFAFLALVALASHFTSQPLSVIPWVAAATLTQNFWMAAHHTAGSYLLGPTWSLAIEEQFYLLLPAVIYFVKPSRLPRFLGAGIVLAPAIRAAAYLADRRLTTAAFVLLPCRMNALLLGAAAAYFLREPGGWELLHARRRQLWIVLELLTAVCGLLLFHPQVEDPLEMLAGFDCFALLFTVLLALSLVDERLAKVLQAKWLMGLGGIAYCVYLIHCPILAITMRALRGHAGGLLVALVAFPLTILIAKISWSWFEKPFINLGHRANYSGKGEGTVSTVGTQPALEGAQP